tara:strand:- start:122 stop:538 length:417 start_codon:yes stop_codon:yes gene_type:complete
MNIYFSGSIRGGRNDVDIYQKIISHLKTFGNVLTEHIGDNSLESDGENKKSNKEIHDRDLELLQESDIIIAEVTNPSLGVGYEIAKAIQYQKKIICIYRKVPDKKISAMILGSNDLTCIEYNNMESLKITLNSYLNVT